MKKIKIGLPCTPSIRISTKQIEAIEVIVTWGGGIGGSSKTHYCTQIIDDEYFLISGEKIYINKDYIVSKKNVKIVIDKVDTTAHANYHEKKCNLQVDTRWILINFGEEWEKYTGYTSFTKRDRLIERTIETV